jgi:uncharacterized protein
VEAAKYGLGRRDLSANVNWFSKVAVADDGTLSLDASSVNAVASVELRFEMDTLVLLHTCAHPLDASRSFPRRPVLYEIFEGPAAAVDDPNRVSTPENARGFENTRAFRFDCRAGAHA